VKQTAIHQSGQAEKTKRIVRKLERVFGVPAQPKKTSPPLDMLIATILSQNTNDINSHRAYGNLRGRFPTWEAVRSAGRASIAAAIRVGGMANQKAVVIKDVLQSLSEQSASMNLRYLSKRSDEEILEFLCSLKGVGRKTASCVLLFSLGRDVFPVDTHVHRICNRLGLVKSCSTPEKTFEAMRNIIPRGKSYSLHINLIKFGRKICRSANPCCGICPLYDECRYPARAKYRESTAADIKDHKVNFMLLEQV
jgi:endonuclease III